MKKKFYVFLIIISFLSFYLYSLENENQKELFKKAVASENQGYIQKAILYYEEYNKSTSDIDKKEKVFLKIARILPEYETKVEKYKEFLNIYSKSKFRFLAQYELANLYKLNNELSKALNENIKLANLSKGSVYWQKANINISILEYELERYDLALEILNGLLEKINDYEDLGTVYFLLGEIMLKKEKYKEAEKFFLICSGSYPQSSKGAVSLFELQYIYILLGKYTEAERITSMLNQLYPDSLENTKAQKKLDNINLDKNKKYLEIELINLNKDINIENKSMAKIKEDLMDSLDIFEINDKSNTYESISAYYIQMGYYSDLKNAQEVIKLFKSKGINDVFYTKTKSSVKSKNIYYRILIGPFKSKSDANKRLIELKEKNIESIILELFKYYD